MPDTAIDFRLDTDPSDPSEADSSEQDSADSARLDFRPSQSSAAPLPTKRKSVASSFAIDFRPHADTSADSAAFGPSLSERAAHLGEPSPLVSLFAPKQADLTGVPISPFTNRYLRPAFTTADEAQRSGTIGPRDPGIGERLAAAIGAGAPEGSKVAEWTGQQGTLGADLRLFAPEQLMTQAEQQRHPILTGAGQFAGGLTSPENLTLIGLTAGAGELAGPGAVVAKRLLSAGFSIPMLVDAARSTPQIADAFQRGDTATGERLLTHAVLTAGMAGLAGRGMFEDAAPLSRAYAPENYPRPDVQSGLEGTQAAQAGSVQSPADLIRSAGLVYKGELVPGTGVHMFEDAAYPGKTAALRASDITSPAQLRDKMNSKLTELGVDPAALSSNAEPNGVDFVATGQTAYSGLGFLDPALIRRAIPQSVKDAASDLLSEDLTTGQREVGIVREQTGQLARSKEQAFHSYADAIKSWDSRPIQEGYDFILREQHGEAQPNAADQTLADNLQKEFAKRRDQIEALPHGSFDNWRENYFPQLWEQPNQVADAIKQQILGTKSPLQGTAGFKRQRVFDDLQEGLDVGFKPVTHNPATMALLKMHELDRYIMAHNILGESKNEGLAKFVAFGDRAPEGWTRLNDSMFRVLQPSAEGPILRGEYYMPSDAAKIVNNYLSPGLRGNTAYDLLRKSGNALNQAQLGISAFHLGFVSLDASVSDMALALERVSRGEVGSTLKPAARSLSILGSPINTVLKGNRLLREYLEPGRYAEMSHLADAVAKAGGRVAIDPIYKNNAIESFWKSWKEGSYGKASLKALPAALELAAKPIMEVIVPRQKLGVFANLAGDALKRADAEGWSKEEVRHELDKVWDSVDNRMGQMVLDNLFWHKAVRDLGLVSVRSLGWNLGTVREIAGGAKDFAKQAGRAAIGESAAVTHRMAYVMALPLVVGFTGAVVHYLSTGKPPKSVTDYFFPQTGRTDSEGRPERVALPSYIKDLYHYQKDPVRTITNKIHPLFSMIADMLRNQDFYGTEIRHPDDPLVRQAGELAEYAGKQFLPFSVRNFQQRKSNEGKSTLSAAAESFIGLSPAPSYITRSAAEQKASELMQRHLPQGPRTAAEFERSQTSRTFEAGVRNKTVSVEDLRSAISAGQLTREQAQRILQNSRTQPLVRSFKPLTLDEALIVWQSATPQEQDTLRPLLREKARSHVASIPPAERPEMIQRIKQALSQTQ